MSTVSAWQVDFREGLAADLHAEAAQLVSSGDNAEVPLGRLVRVVEVSRPAVVLGSAQPGGDIDQARAVAAGIEVARRRSGGGAVMVGPGELLWVDLVVPRGDPLWDDDVGRASWWVGECWAGAIGRAAGVAPDVWRGGLLRTPWSAQVCFAGLGPGEVTVAGAKVVGVSQRRTRRGALFQTAALLRWSPGSLVEILDLDDGRRASAMQELADVALGVGADAGPALLEAFLAGLATAGH